MKKVGHLLILLAGIFYGCSETEEINQQTIGKTYFPLKVGDSLIYNVTDIRYQNNVISNSSTFQLRERVDMLYSNLAGEPTYKIIRSHRATKNDQWLDDSVITVTVSNNLVRRMADNNELVKMVFPLKESKTWNPNEFNTLEPGNAFYQNVGQPFGVNGKEFSNTVTVSVNDFVTAISKDVRKEVYADGIGLVYKDYEIIEYCTVAPCSTNSNYTFILQGRHRTEVLD